MKARRLIVGGAILAALVVTPVVALAGGGPRELLIGFHLQFTGPTSTAGTFVASGAIKDAGASSVEDLALVPIGASGRAKLTGTQRFDGAHGSIVTRFRGVAHDIANPNQWATGTMVIVDATGDYAGLRGNARFTIVVDAAGNTLIGTEEGRLAG